MSTDVRPSPSPAQGGMNSSLPAFIERRTEGVFVDPSKFTVDSAFRLFVDRLFANRARFSKLDYHCFQRLLFSPDDAAGAATPNAVRLAQDIVAFPDQRQALYKNVRLVDGGVAAHYMFQPAFLEIVDPPAAVGQDAQTRLEPTELDVDEFIAAMWLKGVVFGIDTVAVAQSLFSAKPVLVTVASELKPTPPEDARLHEEFDGLHRDSSPLIHNGMADLRSQKNRFPQVRSQQRMLKKIAPKAGTCGFKVNGQMVNPALPKDIDLAPLSGQGTRVENTPDGEFVVALWDGFLVFTPGSGQVSVTEKIDNKSGISAKTTGNLKLTVDEFVERGEVQEGCSVEGRHMKFMAAVFGAVISQAGRIELMDNLSGGRAASPGGSITVHKRASNSRIEAPGGSVRIDHAENCVVVGRQVVIAHAVNCDIIADTLQITTAQACSVAAKTMDIGSTDERHHRPMVVSVLIPDAREIQHQTAVLDKKLAELRALVEARLAEIKRIESEPEFAKFLSIADLLRGGTVKFSPAQEQSFRVVQHKHAAAARLVEKLTADRKALLQTAVARQEEKRALHEQLVALSAGIRCKIGAINGETVVQQRLADRSSEAFAALDRIELARWLSAYAPPAARIQAGADGGVDWQTQT